MTNVRIFTKKFCPGCTKTKELMDKLGIHYQTIDISDDPAAIKALRALGYLSVPIILVDNDKGVTGWTGFQPEKIRGIVGQ